MLGLHGRSDNRWIRACGYAAAILATPIAFGVTYWMKAQGPSPTFLLLIVAVAVAYWLGGIGPSLFSIALALVLAKYFFHPDVLRPGATRAPGVIPFLVFIGVSLAVIWLLDSLDRARRLANSNTAALEEMNTRLRQMLAARRIVGAEEAERRRISRVLHDDVGQVLTALKMNLQRINSAIDKDVAVLKESVELVDQTLAQIRTLAGDLRPTVLDDLGLGEAVAWYAKAQAARAGYALKIEQELGEGRLPTSVETCAFRIVQQALANIARHAQAKNVRIAMRRNPEALEVEVVDDGIGFDVNEARARSMAGGSLGIVHMTEMAEMEGGTLNICSTPGKGSTVAFRFPLGAAT